MIKACLFDMGNVLLYFSHQRMCEQIAAVCGCSVELTKQQLFHAGWQHEIERGDISEDEFHHRWEQLTQRNIERDALIRALSDIFELNHDIIAVLRSLRQGGQRLILLSNTCVSHLTFIKENFEILDYFDELVLSYEVGVMKPHSRIYEAAIEKAGCSPNQCFYTDDIVENILAGQQLGLNTGLFTTVANLRLQLANESVHLSPPIL